MLSYMVINMAKITIKDLVKVKGTTGSYRDVDTGRFVSKKDIELFLEWGRIEKKYEDIKPILPVDKRARIEKELKDLQAKYDDDDYEQPHEYFKIKFPNWDKMDSTEMKAIIGRYFLVDDKYLTKEDKKKGIKAHPSNVMAMKYSLAKLKMEKLEKELDSYE